MGLGARCALRILSSGTPNGAHLNGRAALSGGGVADSIDHVMPRSRGGMNVWENVTAACRPCNLRKRDRTPEEAGMRLATQPHAPRELAWISVSVGRVPEAWKQYLAFAS